MKWLGARGWGLVKSGFQPLATSHQPPLAASDRHCVRRNGARRSRRRRRRRGLAVDELFEFLAGLEVRDLLRRHVHLVARLRVAALARFALAQAEAAEAPQLDLLAA